MSKDIFISYSTNDTDIAEKARDYLEENGLDCWMAPRDIKTSDNYAQEIMDALNEAKIVTLIFSKSSNESPYVLEELDKAYRDKPILPFRIDDVLPKGSMEFYLRNNQWLDASTNPEDFFDDLVKDARRLIELGGGPPEPPVPHEPPKPHDTNDSPEQGFISKYKIPIVALVVLLVAVAGFVMFSANGNGNVDANETGIVVDYIGMDDDSSKGYSWQYSYFVFGTVSANSTSPDDIVHIEFLDDSGKVIESNDTKVSDIEGNILASAYLDDDDVDKVSVELKNTNDKVLYSAESDNIIKQ
ncbi:toll/interleukin-1 receptor domain-containing protein [Methanobrevibacter thaueri]|uniref:toll/interleukin-1 receptor domain-containing protein n=1 Tax=Methanobrevibacter thaueri TaxID=190975 RepID=UPI00386479DD